MTLFQYPEIFRIIVSLLSLYLQHHCIAPIFLDFVGGNKWNWVCGAMAYSATVRLPLGLMGRRLRLGGPILITAAIDPGRRFKCVCLSEISYIETERWIGA
jgi:hypothetical protein